VARARRQLGEEGKHKGQQRQRCDATDLAFACGIRVASSIANGGSDEEDGKWEGIGCREWKALSFAVAEEGSKRAIQENLASPTAPPLHSSEA
jgi:hypothetical protein